LENIFDKVVSQISSTINANVTVFVFYNPVFSANLDHLSLDFTDLLSEIL